MATVNAIGFTVLGGTVVSSLTLIYFGIAVKQRNKFIAPRCTARPPDTIYTSRPSNDVQDRGNPWTGWITWTLSLSYDTMLRGIPGTGTRKGGMEGSMLGVNLDAIILFRFHALCLRVGLVATFLAIGIILPINWTARCYPDPNLEDSYCSDIYNRTTIVNIPNVKHNSTAHTPTETDQSGGLFSVRQMFWNENSETMYRLYLIVLCSFIVTYYTCRQIKNEWRDALALRRAYYLEADHYNNRYKELEDTFFKDDDDEDASALGSPTNQRPRGTGGPSVNSSLQARRLRLRQEKQNNCLPRRQKHPYRHRHRRDPWIPHPEQRDTVPNVEIHSVLVGGLPALPSEVVDREEWDGWEKKAGKRKSIDWQLAVTTAFFDHCVPNQPGFSSSVAAVTILPAAPQLAAAWRCWYKAAAALRRLRFIRTLIADRRHFDIDPDESIASVPEDVPLPPPPPQSDHQDPSDPTLMDNQQGVVLRSAFRTSQQSRSVDDLVDQLDRGDDPDYHPSVEDDDDDDESSDVEDGESARNDRLQYYREVFGSVDNEEVEAQLYHELNYGPEQTAVYSREMAQGAAACCPNGCAEGRVRRARIDELLAMEREAVEAVHEANLELNRARANASYIPIVNNSNTTGETNASSGGASSVGAVGNSIGPKHNVRGTRGELEMSAVRGKKTSPLPTIMSKTGLTSMTADTNNNEGSISIATDYVLPDDLDMEAQLLNKYHQSRESKVIHSRPGSITRSTTGNSVHKRPPSITRSSTDSVMTKSSTGNAVIASPSPNILLTPQTSNSKRRPSPSIDFDDIGRLRNLSEPPRLPDFHDDDTVHAEPSSTPYTPAAALSPEPQMREELPALPRFRSQPAVKHPGLALNTTRASAPPALENNVSALTPSSLGTTTTNTTYRQRWVTNETGVAKPTSLYQYMSMSLNSEGKFFFTQDDPRHSPIPSIDDEDSDDEEASDFISSLPSPTSSFRSFTPNTSNRPSLTRTPSAAFRRSAHSVRWNREPSVEWRRVEKISEDASIIAAHPHSKPQPQFTGEWYVVPNFSSVPKSISNKIGQVWGLTKQWCHKKPVAVVDEWARGSTFAVVTFTNRQAAVAARHCLADGRGNNRFLTVTSIPTPPLADSAACDLVTCRGCCRPVTISINRRQQLIRKFISIALLIVIYIFYTLPITFASSLINPDQFFSLFPELEAFVRSSPYIQDFTAGMVSALLFTLFFALCPVIFRAIANFGSNATSVSSAEMCAMKYYWWFMAITAFAGTSLMTMTLNFLDALNQGLEPNTKISDLMYAIAETLPTQVSATWTNWIIVRTFMVLPLQYLLQLNTFLFSLFGMPCCARCVMGGGPGGPIPYRIYIDTGVVLLCTVSLSYASPLIAPFALIYFLVCQPLWRRNCIYLYRPKFDGGGFRWPFLSEIILSALIIGHILLATMLFLKEAIGPAIFAALQLVPTIMFRRLNHHQYFEAFSDAGLLQTSLLDTWDTNQPLNPEQREAYRRWLVDAHKAAYIPVCIAGDNSCMLTCEPAVVIPRDDELNENVHGLETTGVMENYHMHSHGHMNAHGHAMGASANAGVGTSNGSSAAAVHGSMGTVMSSSRVTQEDLTTVDESFRNTNTSPDIAGNAPAPRVVNNASFSDLTAGMAQSWPSGPQRGAFMRRTARSSRGNPTSN